MKTRTRKKRKGKAYKKRIIQRYVVLTSTFLLAMAYNYRYELRDLYEFYLPENYEKHKQFGIHIPPIYSINGIDVSHHQDKINWKMVSAMQVKDVRIDFAFIKATEGKSHNDSRFKYNWKHARKHKIIRGAYHYFNPHISGQIQALHFIKKVKIWEGDLPPVLDVEIMNGQNKNKLIVEIKKWLNTVENHYKMKPILYTYHDFYKNNLINQFDSYPLWIAHYHVRKPRTNGFDFWQHSDNGKVAGIKPKVDFNVFKGNLSEFKKLLKKN